MKEWNSHIRLTVYILEWGHLNRVNLKTQRTHSCLITYSWSDKIVSFLVLRSVSINVSDALDVLDINIQCDIRWKKYISQMSKETLKCLSFLRITSFHLIRTVYTTYITENDIQLSYFRASWRLQDRVNVLINDGMRVFNSHGCLWLIYQCITHRIRSLDVPYLQKSFLLSLSTIPKHIWSYSNIMHCMSKSHPLSVCLKKNCPHS